MPSSVERPLCEPLFDPLSDPLLDPLWLERFESRWFRSRSGICLSSGCVMSNGRQALNIHRLTQWKVALLVPPSH
jgi:hypothetical protein